jgi:U3 small nucleolar RNA-associated protein 15
VIVYDALTNEVASTLTRFKDVAYGATFRADGRLIVAGGQLPIVQVFDVGTRAILRSFRGHTGAVRVTRFAADQTHVISMSDDKTVRYWDLTTEQSIATIHAHTDYVRAGCASLSSTDVWFSGAYDAKVCVWDVRAANNSTPMSTFDHGAPVEVTPDV